MRALPVFLFLGMMLMISPAFAVPDEPQKGARPTAPAAPAAEAAPADVRLEQEIRARFASSKIAEENFRVHVWGGVVTLTGNTSVVQRKGTATRLARLAGAKTIRNRIEVERRTGQRTESRRRVKVERSERD